MADAPNPPDKVLVVDDEPTIVELISRMLRKTELLVIGVDSGEDALRAMTEHGPIVVLTDKNLPGINGLEVIRRGLELIPDAQFIMMTGYASLESVLGAMELGVSAYLTKPFTRAQVTEQVLAAADHVRKKRETQAALERMRGAAKKRMTGPIAIRSGLDELNDVVHKLERLVTSVTSLLDSRPAEQRKEDEALVKELLTAIRRLSQLQSHLPKP